MPLDDNEIVGFSPGDADRLLDLVDVGEVSVKIHSRPAASNRVIHVKTQGGGIPGRSGLTMGSGTCDRYDCSAAGVLSDSGTDVTVYNLVTGAVAATTHILAAYNTAGLLVAIVEDCG